MIGGVAEGEEEKEGGCEGGCKGKYFSSPSKAGSISSSSLSSASELLDSYEILLTVKLDN